jgi:hypothetical protein
MAGGAAGLTDHLDVELRLLRARVEFLERALDRLEGADLAGGTAIACKTSTGGSYPSTGANTTFLVQALDVAGAATEGAAGAVSARTGTFLAVNVGSALPTLGTEVLVHVVDYCPVFKYDG